MVKGTVSAIRFDSIASLWLAFHFAHRSTAAAPQTTPIPNPAPIEMANSEVTEVALTPVPPAAIRRAMEKIARAVPSLSRDSACRTVRPKRLIPLPSAATAVASVGPRHAPTRSAPPADNPIARPAATMAATQTMMSNSRLMGISDLHGNGLRQSTV